MSQTPKNRMLTRMGEARAQVAERDELTEVIAITLPIRKNIFILGDTGQAKSAIINLFRTGITGINQFEWLMSKQTDEEALFGHLDLSSLIPGGMPEKMLEKNQHYQGLRRELGTELQAGGSNSASQLADLTAEMEQYRKVFVELYSGESRIITRGKPPNGHAAFLDGTFEAPDGTLDIPLTAFNERRYISGSKTIYIPTIPFFSVSNEIPNSADLGEKILKPFYDRFEFKVVTEYAEDRDAHLTILKQKQAAQSMTRNPPAVISLVELQAMRDEVLQIHILDQVNGLMDDVLCRLRGRGIHISDRKYLDYASIAQAKVWLGGRDTVEPSDLTTLYAHLWTVPEKRTITQSTLEQMCNDPLKDWLDIIPAGTMEGYREFADTADVPAARRIGKLRDELMSLYITLSQMLSNAQNGAEREKINACLGEPERYSKGAHASVQYSCVPLREPYDLEVSWQHPMIKKKVPIMLNYNLPLTKVESEFAAEHHSVIYGYLHKAGLLEDNFYDVVVFGYPRVVRKHLVRPELRKYSFSTIAYWAMSCSVHRFKECWIRKRRRALVEPLDEELHIRDLLDPVSAVYENMPPFQELSGKLTQKQRQIAVLRVQGYRGLEIAHMLQVKPGEIKLEVDQTYSKAVPSPMETAVLAA